MIANSATARTTTGSALAFNEVNSALSKQSSATASSDATTTTGQAAGLALAQSIGGVHADSQGAASATTSTGVYFCLLGFVCACGCVLVCALASSWSALLAVLPSSRIGLCLLCCCCMLCCSHAPSQYACCLCPLTHLPPPPPSRPFFPRLIPALFSPR